MIFQLKLSDLAIKWLHQHNFQNGGTNAKL
jgi:hypothetical protein